jgi:hypothetical protein
VCSQSIPVVAIVMLVFQIKGIVFRRMQKKKKKKRDGMFARDREWIRVTEA